jgi:hypothetical protein
MAGKRKQGRAAGASRLPAAKAEDVEFSREAADRDDLEAQRRAAEADRRAAEYEGT